MPEMMYEDSLKKAGGLDPTKVTRIALENAGSLPHGVDDGGGIKVTSQKKKVAHPHPGGMDGNDVIPDQKTNIDL